MSKSLNFKRKFFILKKEYSNMRGVNPKGHGKLELRNNKLKISINIDNAESNTYYNVTLLGNNRMKELGKLHTDKRHGGKVDFDLNYKDIESMGFPLEKINGILILRDKKILLGGYIDKDDKTIEGYIDKLMRQEDRPPVAHSTAPTTALDEDLPLEHVDTEEYMLDELPTKTEETIIGDEELISSEEKFIENDLFIENDVINDIIEESVIEEQFMSKDLITQEETREQEDQPPALDDSNQPIVTEEAYDKAMQEMFNDAQFLSSVDESVYMNVDAERKLNQKEQTTNYVLNILSFFPYIDPFKIDLMGYNWWKIDIDDPKEDKGFLPYFSYIAGGNHKYPLVQNTVTATALMRKHGHYLFGLYNSADEVKFYVYGVPGDFTKEDHPQKGTTGFNAWFEGRNGIGYWLLYIDPTNGRVIYPINPMIPKD